MEREIGWAEPVGRKVALVPRGTGEWDRRDIGQARDFFRSQLQRNGGEVIAELSFGAATEYQRIDSGAGQEPGQSDLGCGNAARLTNFYKHIHDVPQFLDVPDRGLCPAGELA